MYNYVAKNSELVLYSQYENAEFESTEYEMFGQEYKIAFEMITFLDCVNYCNFNHMALPCF